VPSFLLKILGWLKLILGKLIKSEPSQTQRVDFKAGRDINVENVINVILQTPGFSNQENQVASMGTQIKEVLNKMSSSQPSKEFTPTSESEDYKQVLSLIKGEPTKEKKIQLRTIFYTSNDKATRLQVVHALTNWFTLPEDSIDVLITMCDEGIRIADLLSSKSEKAVLLAYKGKFVSMQFASEDINAVFSSRASNLVSNLTGISLVSEEQKQQIIQKLRRLDQLSQECFASAQKLAKEVEDYNALAHIYTLIGQAAADRYIYLKKFGVNRAEREKELCKHALLIAKEIYSAMRDELGSAYALHNLANHLRFCGETEEAKQVTQKVIEIAEKYDEKLLLKKANILLQRIMSGKAPDFTAGEIPNF
jgi:tetratricopeptide (TPR) repeat protein